jgi:hypothetical protein
MTMPPSPEKIARDVQAAFDELDPLQMAVFRRMTPAQRGQGVGDLFDAMKEMVVVTERQAHPDLPDEEIHRRAMLRLMRASEWEPELRKTIFGS